MGAEPLGEAGPPLRLRAFFGLPVPEAQRRELAAYLERCAAVAPAFRWVAAGNLHLTVRFLGQVDGALADGIVERLSFQELPAFELELGEPGTFKRGRLARVVWLGLRRGLEPAGALSSIVEAECRRAGLEAEARPFQAHLTLARARDREGSPLPALPPPPRLEPWRAGELVLYRSRLGRAGSVYEPLRTLPLG